MSKNKIVIIGGGKIASKIVDFAPETSIITSYPVRQISNSKVEYSKILNECLKSNQILFLAFHHRDFFKNIILINKILRFLMNCRWKGCFVFFNTQATMSDGFVNRSGYCSQKYIFDFYTCTKKIQSCLISWYSSSLFVSELYLPIVFGEGTSIQDHYKKICNASKVYLPNRGENRFACIDINILVYWVWDFYLNKLTINRQNIDFRRVFVYQQLCTFAEKLQSLQEADAPSSSSKEIGGKKIKIEELNLKYFGTNRFSRGLIEFLKVSPIGLLIVIFRYEVLKIFKKDIDSKFNNSSLPSAAGPFSPSGTEYIHFDSTICIEKIPIKVIKINK